MDTLYPLRFKEIVRQYRFGERWIVDAFAKQGLPEDQRIGETWEVCDRPGESSEVVNGPLRGKTLHDLIEMYQDDLLGTGIVSRSGLRFPLLIKFLDVTHALSEQAHHNDDLARARGLADPGKTEAWYMVKTKPRSTAECGHRDGVTGRQLVDAMLADDIRSCMNRYSVSPGDAFLLYAGTMHYSEGGLLFYEVMQNSDVYVSLRAPSEELSEGERLRLVTEAAEAVHLEDDADIRPQPVVLVEGDNRRVFVLACRHFALERLDLTSACTVACSGERFFVLTVIEGQATVTARDDTEPLAAGQSCLLPASLGPVTLEPVGQCSVLKAYVPDLVGDVVEPLRRQGVSNDAIVALGGRTTLNDLAGLM